MIAQNMENLIRSYFGFLFDDYGFKFTKCVDECLFYLKSDLANIKFRLGKHECGVFFWPHSAKEEDALPVELLYLYYKYNGLVPSKKDMQHFHSENVNIERCFQQKRDMLLHINRLFQESECPWWGLACSFSKKWIEVDLGMVK